MAGLYGIWDWHDREPTAVERTLVAWVILVSALVCAAALVLGVAGLMFAATPAS